MVKVKMKNNGNQLHATGKDLDNKTMIFFLYSMNHFFFFLSVFLWFIRDVFPNREI